MKTEILDFRSAIELMVTRKNMTTPIIERMRIIARRIPFHQISGHFAHWKLLLRT